MTKTLFNLARIAAVASMTGLSVAACTGNLLPGAANDPPKLYILTPKNTFKSDLP